MGAIWRLHRRYAKSCFWILSLIVLLLVYIQNKEELEDTRKVLTEQSETLKIQRFEQTFFSLLSLYREITSNLHFKHSYEQRKAGTIIIEDNKDGKAVIEHLNHLMRLKVTVGSEQGQKKANYDSIESLNRLYIDFNRENERYFMHYVKTIHRILEFLDGADIKNKQIYANLLKDQFSQAEVQFLFYNSICTVDKGNTLGMLIKYNIFEDINKNHLVDKEIDLQIFEELKQNIK